MKKEWKTASLGDLCEMYQPKTLTKKELAENGPYAVFGANGIMGWHDQFNHADPELLIGCRGACGTIHFSLPNSWITGNAMVVRPRSERVSREFLRYFFLGPAKLGEVITGAAQPQITQASLKPISVPLPSEDEQKRIVAVLDEAFEGLDRARANAEANLADAQEVFQAGLRKIFQGDAVGWPRRTLPSVCTQFGRGKSRHRPRNDPKLYGGEVPFIQTGDISRADHLILDYAQSYSEFGLQQSKLWPAGTVCVAIVGATIGESAITCFDACFPDSVIGMVPDPKIADAEFIEFSLCHFKGSLKEAGKGSARDNINLATFEERDFPIPTIETQLEVVIRLKELAAVCAVVEERYADALQDLAQLQQSLLQKAFSGELT